MAANISNPIIVPAVEPAFPESVSVVVPPLDPPVVQTF
jgi:hypothetical protein